MSVLITFAAGFCFGGFFVALVWKLAERECQRGGMLDLTGIDMKGGTASANPEDADELSGGLTSRPPSHLHLLKGERE